MGMMSMDKAFAFDMFCLRSSFFSANSSIALFSWQNTLMTFSPFTISSMKPLSSPSDFCCFTKYPPERDAMDFTKNSEKKVNPTVSSVSHMLRCSIEQNTATRLITELNS